MSDSDHQKDRGLQTRRQFLKTISTTTLATTILLPTILPAQRRRRGIARQIASRARVQVADLNGAPALFVNGRPLAAIAYKSYLPHRARYVDFADAGYQLFSVACYFAGDRGINSDTMIEPFRPGVWIGPDEYDFSPVDEDLQRVVDGRPDALVLLRVNLDVPAWWDELYPEECNLLADGTRMRQSFSSEVWREQAGKTLLALIDHIAASPFADSVIAYHLGSGRTEEWAYHGFTRDRFPDYSEPQQRAFRRWLSKEYGSDESLRAAWRQPEARLQEVTIPSAEARRGDTGRLWRDPETEQPVIDYYRFHSHVVADAVIHFCRIAKERTGDSALAGAFYGYTAETTSLDVGQHALQEVMDSPHVEFLCSPNSYLRGRQPGNDWPYFTVTDSVKLHGKLWWTEADTRTHLTEGLSAVAPEISPSGSEPGVYDSGLWRGPDDVGTVLGLLEKNLARALVTGVGLWWFDMWGGWYNDPKLMDFMVKARKLSERALEWDRRSVADVAVFIDEKSYAHFGLSRDQNLQFVQAQRLELARMGAPHDIFHFQDLLDERTHGYRLYVFLNTVHAGRDLRRTVRRLRDRGKSFLWCHGAGWFGGDGAPGIEGVADLTGIEVKAAEQRAVLRARTNSSDHPLLKGIRSGTVFGAINPTGAPLVHPVGTGNQVLASVFNSDIPGVAVNEHKGGYSVYSVAPRTPPRLLQNLARTSGVHIYNEGDDVFYANRHLVGLHATSDGMREIRLPRAARSIVDAFTEEVLARNADRISFECDRHRTRLFLID